jgi:hypothetical protein
VSEEHKGVSVSPRPIIQKEEKPRLDDNGKPIWRAQGSKKEGQLTKFEEQFQQAQFKKKL